MGVFWDESIFFCIKKPRIPQIKNGSGGRSQEPLLLSSTKTISSKSTGIKKQESGAPSGPR